MGTGQIDLGNSSVEVSSAQVTPDLLIYVKVIAEANYDTEDMACGGQAGNTA